MADMYGRLTGRAGVCLGTLGPGAMNLVTAVADAFLDRAPLVALTGQADLERMHKESHQYIDIVEVMRPITKWNARADRRREIIPEVVRKAFKVAESEKPGADAPRAARGRHGAPSRRRAAAAPRGRVHARAGRARAARGRRPHPRRASTRSRWPATASSAPAPRPRCASSSAPPASPSPRRSWARALLDYDGPQGARHRRPAVARLRMAGFEDADVVIAIGYDLVEHSPEHWNPKRDKKIVVHRLRAGRDRRVLHRPRSS